MNIHQMNTFRSRKTWSTDDVLFILRDIFSSYEFQILTLPEELRGYLQQVKLHWVYFSSLKKYSTEILQLPMFVWVKFYCWRGIFRNFLNSISTVSSFFIMIVVLQCLHIFMQKPIKLELSSISKWLLVTNILHI